MDWIFFLGTLVALHFIPMLTVSLYFALCFGTGRTQIVLGEVDFALVGNSPSFLLTSWKISSLPRERTMHVVVGSIQPDGKERSAGPRAHRRPPGHVVRTGPRNGGRILCRSVSVSGENEAENGLPHPPFPGGT